MAIPLLPPEIILQILEAGYFNHKFRPDRYFLNSCCRVCRAWLAQAQPLLFRHVEVRSPSSLAGLNEALTRPRHGKNALQEVVLWLRIWIGFSESVSSPAALSSLLTTCSNLYGLSVTFRDMWTLPEEPPILPPNILALECCDWEYKLGPEIARILIRSGWHSLRILIIRGYPSLHEISPNLAELRVVERSTVSTSLHEALTFLRPQLNLRILEITPYPKFVPLLELSQHSLESVQMLECMSPMHLKCCHRLREFKVETPISQELFQILRDLPLEHLAYAVLPTWYTKDFSKECVSLSPALKVVSCLTSIRPWNEGMTKYIDDLEYICNKKHVRLEYFTTLVSFRALTVCMVSDHLVLIYVNTVHLREDPSSRPTHFLVNSWFRTIRDCESSADFHTL